MKTISNGGWKAPAQRRSERRGSLALLCVALLACAFSLFAFLQGLHVVGAVIGLGMITAGLVIQATVGFARARAIIGSHGADPVDISLPRDKMRDICIGVAAEKGLSSPQEVFFDLNFNRDPPLLAHFQDSLGNTELIDPEARAAILDVLTHDGDACKLAKSPPPGSLALLWENASSHDAIRRAGLAKTPRREARRLRGIDD